MSIITIISHPHSVGGRSDESTESHEVYVAGEELSNADKAAILRAAADQLDAETE
jgi:hypothetical protein